MAIDITFSINDRLISISTWHSDYSDFQRIEKFYYDIVYKALSASVVTLITKDPRPYSFAQGLGISMEQKTRDGKVLLNGSFVCETLDLFSIIESEEFRRGLLLIAGSNLDELLPHLEIIHLISNDLTARNLLPFELIFCGDDGNSLYLYNTNLNIYEVESFINLAVGNKV
jgi:hypothetical protein